MIVKVYNPDTFQTERSGRDYDVFRVTAIQAEESFGGMSHDSGVTLTMYRDTSNGLMVADVLKYEAWLNR